MLYFVFDVESIGLHGEGFAVGVCIVDQDGKEEIGTRLACSPDVAAGNLDGRLWVGKHTPLIPADYVTPKNVRDSFWALWEQYRDRAVMVTDCGWPVEARFLAQCVDDDPARSWGGPYPLHDVATALLLSAMDPLGKYPRRPEELPEHDPLADARQSARIWLLCLNGVPMAADTEAG